MKMKSRRYGALVVGLSAALAGACSDDPVSPNLDDGPALLSVEPSGGSTGVEVGATVVVTFDHAIADGMEEYAALHEGSVTGALVAGVWSLSADRTTLTFTPAAPLKPATTYVIHIGGGMTDDHGNHVNLQQHGTGMGGEWATGSMMTGGMGMNQIGSTMMGAGWAHPTNGSYGMLFSFITAG